MVLFSISLFKNAESVQRIFRIELLVKVAVLLENATNFFRSPKPSFLFSHTFSFDTTSKRNGFKTTRSCSIMFIKKPLFALLALACISSIASGNELSDIVELDRKLQDKPQGDDKGGPYVVANCTCDSDCDSHENGG